jgi:hypothetical protein
MVVSFLPCWNKIFATSTTMKKNDSPSLELALKAFTFHQPVSLKKKNGEFISEGYILIMYGDVAFRMQDLSPNRDSHFVTISDIEEISVRETEPLLS